MNRQARLGENICKTCIWWSTGSQIYKEPVQLNNNKTTQFFKGQKIWTDTSQRRYTNGQKAHKFIRGMQIKNTMRYHHTQSRMAKIKKITCGKDVE